jgi:class 3 adenylate cyclase
MTTRRLTTILAADVVGYSRLMGTDEAGMLGAFRSGAQPSALPEAIGTDR